MLNRESLPLDAVEIGRNRSLWLPVSRGVAITESRSRTVAVIHRAFGRDTVSLFQPSNRFFRSNGPYLYDGLRYFLYLGAGVSALQGGGKSLGKTNKPPEAELEPLEFEDQATGEFRSLGSPTAKVPKQPGAPKPPVVPGKVELALEIAGEIKDLREVPSLPEIPEIPEVPDIPDLPTIPEFAIPTVPEAPKLPAVPEIPALPEIPEIPRPVEILLTDAKGIPLRKVAFRAEFPDGKIETGQSDNAGFIRFLRNTQEGELLLTLTDALAGAEKERG